MCFADTVVTGRVLPKDVDELVTRTSAGGLIVYKRGLAVPDQRFAIAHALSHLLYDLDAEHDAAGVGFVGNPKCEARADAFGAELLVPLADLAQHVNQWPSNPVATTAEREHYLDQVDQIAGIFNVPQWVIAKRISKLESMTRRYGEIA